MITYTYKVIFKSGESFNVTSEKQMDSSYDNGVPIIRFGYSLSQGFYPVSEIKGVVFLSQNEVSEDVKL